MLVQAAGSLGMQAPVYALMTSLLTGKSSYMETDSSQGTIGRRVLDEVCASLTKALAAGAFIQAKLLLRFLGELCNCRLVRPSELVDLFMLLGSNYLPDPDPPNSERVLNQPCKDIVAHMLASALLWCGHTMHQHCSAGLSDLVDLIQAHINSRKPIFARKGLRSLLQAEGTAEPVTDGLVQVWAVLSQIHDGGWQEEKRIAAIPRPSEGVTEQLNSVSSLSLPDDIVGPETIPANLQRMGDVKLASCREGGFVPAPGSEESMSSPCSSIGAGYCLALMAEWDLFDSDGDGGAATVAHGALEDGERVVLREYIKDVVASFEPIIKQDGTRAGSFTIAVEQLLSVGKLAPEGCDSVYLVVETLFLLLAQLPEPTYFLNYVGRLLVEMGRVRASTAPAVAFATGALFQELEVLDLVAGAQFAKWFASHLKDTGYAWPFWSHWEKTVELEEDNPERIFVAESLRMLVQLSYVERIKDTVPEALWPLLPAPEAPPHSKLLDSGGDDDGLEVVAQAVLDRVMSKASCQEIRDWLELELGKESDAKATVTLLMHAVLRAGTNSPSHLVGMLMRYRDWFLDLASKSGCEMAIMEVVQEAWASSRQWFLLTVEELLRSYIVSPEVVVEFFFRPDVSKTLACNPSLWIMLKGAITIQLERIDAAVSMLQKSADGSGSDDENGKGGAAPPEDELKGILEDALDEARKISELICSGFPALFAAARTAGESGGMAVMCYFKAALRLLITAKEIPQGLLDEAVNTSILDAKLVESCSKACSDSHIEALMAAALAEV
ncbi:unnamed protein product [Chrysoparadoxa australica]